MAPRWSDEEKRDLLKFMIENGGRSDVSANELYEEAKRKIASLYNRSPTALKRQFKKLVPTANSTKIDDKIAVELARDNEIFLSNTCLENFETKFRLTYKKLIVFVETKVDESKSSESVEKEETEEEKPDKEEENEEEGAFSDSNKEDLNDTTLKLENAHLNN